MNSLHASRIAPRLLAGFGTASLVTAVGLFASSRPAHTAGGPVPVTVANTVQNSDVDNPDKQPFQEQMLVTIPSGQNSAEAPFNVPAGKRLVIETVALIRDNLSSASLVQLYVSAQAGTAGNTFGVYPAATVGTEGLVPGVTQPLHVRADPGTTVYLTEYRQGGTGTDQEVDDVTVSGYLVDMP